MAKLSLTLTPKPPRSGKAAITHHDVASGIKVRSLIVDWKKTKELVTNEILNEFTNHITNSAVREGIQKKVLTGLPNDYPGKHELYVFVGDDKATKIELTVEDEPQIDIRRVCPLFANARNERANAEYLGGTENEPHVHIYGGGFHLKLGSKRFDIVQNGKLYAEPMTRAHDELKGHALKDKLGPCVAAALKKFNFLE